MASRGRQSGHGRRTQPGQAAAVRGAGRRGTARAGIPRAGPRAGCLVRARARPAAYPPSRLAARGRGSRRLARRRLSARHVVVAGPEHRPWPAACRRRVRRPVGWRGPCRVGAAPPACHGAPRARRRVRHPKRMARDRAIRSWQALGGPWALFGASQWRHPLVLGLAAIGGVWLISAVLVAANTGILVALVSSRTAARAAGIAAAAACVAAGPLAYAVTNPAAPVRGATLALVQPGIVADPRIRVNASQRLTASLAARRQPVRPDLIVWGESSVAYNLNSHPWLLGQIRALSARMGAEILLNQDAPRGAGHISKVAVLVSPTGVQGSYVKSRLVPFGEYIPFRQALGWLTRVSRAASANRIPGNGARLLQVTTRGGPPLPIGVLICFESAFPDMSRVAADKGAELIVYQSATSTFQDSWAPAQHASLGALRAAETGRPVVQAALTGISAAFDSRGRNLGWLPTSRHGVAVVRLALPAGGARTVYDRFGDYVPLTAAGVSAIAAAVGLIRRRRRPAGQDRAGRLAGRQRLPRRAPSRTPL